MGRTSRRDEPDLRARLVSRDGRYAAVAALGGTMITVIFKPLGSEALSIIPMRRVRRKEREIAEAGSRQIIPTQLFLAQLGH